MNNMIYRENSFEVITEVRAYSQQPQIRENLSFMAMVKRRKVDFIYGLWKRKSPAMEHAFKSLLCIEH